MQQFSFKDGAVKYRSKFQSEVFVNTIKEQNNAETVFTMGDTKPSKSWFGRWPLIVKLIWNLAYLTPALNINVTAITTFPHEQLILKTDVNAIAAIDLETLETTRLFQYNDINPAFGGPGAAAHPQFDKGNLIIC